MTVLGRQQRGPARILLVTPCVLREERLYPLMATVPAGQRLAAGCYRACNQAGPRSDTSSGSVLGDQGGKVACFPPDFLPEMVRKHLCKVFGNKASYCCGSLCSLPPCL